MYYTGPKGGMMDQCQVKGCSNTATYSYITHENGDKEMCQECKEKYLTKAKPETCIDMVVPPTKSERLEYMMFILRQKVGIAKEAKEIGYGDDLFSYSIQSAEQLITEMEKLIN